MMSREVHHVYFILSKPSYCPVFHSLMPNNVWVVTAIIYVLVLLKGLSWVGGWGRTEKGETACLHSAAVTRISSAVL